jgi:hypothetical protein
MEEFFGFLLRLLRNFCALCVGESDPAFDSLHYSRLIPFVTVAHIARSRLACAAMVSALPGQRS